MKHLLLSALILLAGCASEPEAEEASAEEPAEVAVKLVSIPPTSAAEAEEQACRRMTFEEVLLTHCIADPEKHRISTILGPKDGEPFRGMGRLAQARGTVEANTVSMQVVFAFNAGMFDEAGKPIGYYVENGERLKKLNRNKGKGNFHLLPNGVFYGSDGKWEVRSSDWFVDNVTERPDFGTQSGPMLVIDGEIHPKFADDGESKYIRNGVGVDEDGFAHFVISEMPLSFGKLARFYRDELKVPNALYLDGNVSALWYPKGARIDASPPLGPLIVVEKRTKPKDVEAEQDIDPASADKTEAKAGQ